MPMGWQMENAKGYLMANQTDCRTLTLMGCRTLTLTMRYLVNLIGWQMRWQMANRTGCHLVKPMGCRICWPMLIG